MEIVGEGFCPIFRYPQEAKTLTLSVESLLSILVTCTESILMIADQQVIL